MTLDELADILVKFTQENSGKAAYQKFFRLLNRLSAQGMGVGIGADVASSGEIASMGFVRDALKTTYPDGRWNIFDVGANTGKFATAAIEIFGAANRRYFCFEPSAQAFAKLVEAVGGRENVSLHRFGLGERDDTLPLFADAPGSGLGSLYDRQLDHYGIPMRKIEDVSIQTIDGFAQDHAIERIHFLKLDVEGHELNCLEGANGMLGAGRIDFIQFEFGGTNIDSRTYFRDFWQMLKQYKIKRILRDGFCDIEKYSETEEMFETQNYLACLIKRP